MRGGSEKISGSKFGGSSLAAKFQKSTMTVFKEINHNF
jgi:hypothetical protein